MAQALTTAAIAFGRNIVGIVTRPYETYRRIVHHSNLWEMVFIGIVVVLYLGVASIVKTSLFRPFLLTRQFFVLGTGVTATFLLTVFLFWQVSRVLGSQGNLVSFALAWAYSLIPTAAWFWMTSLLYIILPPPRTTSVLGIIFSVMYLLISATLFFWKIILSYLALRFGLRLDLKKISILSAVVLPMLVVYSIGMYRMGIFRIPFI